MKKLFLYTMALCIAAMQPLKSMDQENSSHSLPTKIWSIAKEHPVIAGSLVAGAALSGLLLYQADQTRKAKSLPYLCKLIATNSNAALEIAQSVSQTWDTNLATFDQEKNKAAAIRVLLEKYNAKCPIFLLGECSTPNCSLTRKYWPQYREKFEQRTVNLLSSKINNDPVHYVGFGAGGLFQDLVILSKTLTQKPNATITIHLIDPKFFPYATCKNALNQTREVTTESTIDITPASANLIETIRKDAPSLKQPDAEILDNLSAECILLETKVKQFLNCLKQAAPNATFAVLVHPSAKQYLEYIEKNNISYPDVLCAADIQDEMSCLRHAPIHYIWLCKQLQLKKPTVSNIWLTNCTFIPDSAEICTLVPNKTATSISEEVEFNKNQKETIYIESEKLKK